MSALPPAETVTPAEAQSILDAREEQRASQALGLDNALDIENLQRPAKAQERELHEYFQKNFRNTETLTLDEFVTWQINGQIVEIVRHFLPPETSLMGYLGDTELASATLERVRTTPAVYLEKLLTSPKAQALTDQLLKALQWYGANPGEQTAPTVRTQLLGKAIRLYLNAPSAAAPQEIAGYAWQQREHWGLSYQAIRARFETHLHKTQRVATANEAVLLARLYQTQLSPDFAVRDIPADLRYRSSVVWVNFMHGVLLSAETPASPPLGFQQLVNLPITLSMDAAAEKLQAIALARLLPTLQWAVTQGLIPEHEAMNYNQEEIERAVKALDEHSEALRNAITQLDVPTPDRMTMAKREMAKLFGRTAFISDGLKLVEEDTGGSGGGTVKVPLLKNPRVVAFSFLDLYVTGKLANGKKWKITGTDGKSTGARWIRIDDERKIQIRGGNVFGDITNPTIFGFLPEGKRLPDVGKTFKTSFESHLISIKGAYRTLIISLLASLPQADRQAVEQGKIRVLSLRQVTQGVRKEDETPQITMPLRARTGFVLEVSHRRDVFYYELLPLAGVIRCRPDVDASMVGGVDATHTYGASTTATFLRSKRLPFDWSAHAKGTVPVEGKRISAILDQVGETLPAATGTIIDLPPLSSPRQKEVADFIVANFLYQDEKLLYTAARGRTRFDEIDEEIERKLSIIKSFVPFWSSIEDLMSGDKKKIFAGALGLVADLASFLYPMGKFISGSARLIKVAATAGRIGTQASLPSFSTLTRKLLVSTLQNLNPLDGIPTLLKSILIGGGKLTVLVGKTGFRALQDLTGHADQYHLVKGLPQLIEPGRWKPMSNGDQLATVNGIDDVPVRNVATSDKPLYHLVDPNSGKAYGPRLSTRANALAPGRSSYATLEKTDSHLIVELSEKSHVREILEIDGRTTMLIDDVPYRLDGDTLRRAELIDDQALFKQLPCRLRRMAGADVCQTRYVTRDPAPTPPVGQFDESKGWAPWFGDSIYTPAGAQSPQKASALAAHDTLQASLQFQKGIFGRVKVDIPVPKQELTDTFEEGAILIEALDGSKHYIFTRLNAGDFYVAERLKGQSLQGLLTLRKAATVSDDLKNELMVVYTGSLNANNIARIHGIEAVERAIKTMDDIAIPIGGHANPPDTLKLLKVDTSPGEAVLFDHSTRMIVSQLPEGATTWSRSKEAPEAFRLKTAEIFDTLFLSPTIPSKNANTALRINDCMQKLQKLLPRRERPINARNIAYAEVTTVMGKREIYVSVSGAQGSTRHLPIFRHLGAHHVNIGETTYINIDYSLTFPKTSLDMSETGKLLAVPLTIKDIGKYEPAMTARPTSLDSESKLINVIREKYPDPSEIRSVDVATTMHPCESCSVVMKEFGHDGGVDALQVLWT
ncbi:hypothetical protein ACQKP7_20095 [Pseudomonas frederiksbergensis]|uniref:hypothetical protein n=1 Tax=Pseudomonas frederiksbergensis TaxID=104087 RepID=UPI003D062724